MSASTVAIAGASGFVGRALTLALAADRRVVALSRRGTPPTQELAQAEGDITWRSCDMFHLRQVENALEGADVAVYLVHSMLPAARLSQGNFADLDLICADNFARAAKARGVRRIVYLGGLLPEQRPLSQHLESRHEVEEALAGHGAEVTVLRAGLILGPGGSSAQMMVRLVGRLPALVLPRWCQSFCQPSALQDVVDLLVRVVAEPALGGKVYDVGGPDVLRYADMLRRCAKHMGLRRMMLEVPAFQPNLSLLWVAWVTGTPMELVRPLVMSLQHDMVVRPSHDAKALLGRPWMGFDAALKEALPIGCAPRGAASEAPRKLGKSRAVGVGSRGVVSVQRLPLPPGRDAAWVADAYATWLPRGFFWLRPVIDVVRGQDAQKQLQLRFVVRGVRWTLLELTLGAQRSNASRQLFYISGGGLARPTEQALPGRFEFRSVLGRRYVLAAIHDFVPRLPWLVYKFSQAVLHGLVMAGFGRYLGQKAHAVASAGEGDAKHPNGAGQS